MVKRSGLHVRTRAGYYGVADREPPPATQDVGAQLLAALRSPFVAGEIGLRLTGLFGNAADTGSYIHAMLHIDGRDLTFVENGADWKKAELDLVLVAVGENGAAVETSVRHYQIRVSRRDFHRAVKQGFLYRLMYPRQQPGAYQMQVLPCACSSKGVRLPMDWWFTIPGWRETTFPRSTSRRALFRDGKPVWSAPPVPLASPSPGDPTRVRFMKDLDLDPTMPPGEYLLQVTAIDKLAPKKSMPVSQWTDFALVPAT